VNQFIAYFLKAVNIFHLARKFHEPTTHFANRLRVNEFVIPRRITTDMPQSSSPVNTPSITQTEPRVREIFGLGVGIKMSFPRELPPW
jgi:hypothetical protein